MPWVRRNLRGTKVFALVGPSGDLEKDADGRVPIRYKYDAAAKTYRASARNLEETGDPADREALPDLPDAPVVEVETVERGHPADAIVVYTDGACSGNPGPMGIGVVLLDGGERRELSEYLGQGTNNIAELTAIERALDSLSEGAARKRVLVHTDSSYAIGLLAGGFKAKANVDLVMRLREKVRRFPGIRFVKVEGHAGVPENERCDELARAAIKGR